MLVARPGVSIPQPHGHSARKVLVVGDLEFEGPVHCLVKIQPVQHSDEFRLEAQGLSHHLGLHQFTPHLFVHFFPGVLGMVLEVLRFSQV